MRSRQDRPLASGRLHSPRAIEILFAGFGVSGLQVGSVDAFASSRFVSRLVLTRVDKRYQAGNFIVRMIKVWHTFVGAAVANDRADLVSIQVLPHEPGASQVRSAFSAARVASMAKGAILPEKCSTLLNQIWRILFRASCDVLLDAGCRQRPRVGRSLRCGNCEAQQQSDQYCASV